MLYILCCLHLLKCLNSSIFFYLYNYDEHWIVPSFFIYTIMMNKLHYFNRLCTDYPWCWYKFTVPPCWGFTKPSLPDSARNTLSFSEEHTLRKSSRSSESVSFWKDKQQQSFSKNQQGAWKVEVPRPCHKDYTIYMFNIRGILFMGTVVTC